MFYDQFLALCEAKGVKPGRACIEMGLSRSLAAKWKNTKTEKPSADVLAKMSAYFGKSIESILGVAEPSKDDELDELLETLKNRPDMRLLFNLASTATPEDVMRAVKIIEALKEE